MAVHELGHVFGAVATGGSVQQVVLHPLTISRTDVMPNPNPTIVVWMGPIVGSTLPIFVWLLVPNRRRFARRVAQFFAGFCLVANGAYISFGSFSKIGDCGEMLRCGSPHWSLLAFGVVTLVPGFFLWHRLGSLKTFLADQSLIDARIAFVTLLALIAVAACLLGLFD